MQLKSQELQQLQQKVQLDQNKLNVNQSQSFSQQYEVERYKSENSFLLDRVHALDQELLAKSVQFNEEKNQFTLATLELEHQLLEVQKESDLRYTKWKSAEVRILIAILLWSCSILILWLSG